MQRSQKASHACAFGFITVTSGEKTDEETPLNHSNPDPRLPGHGHTGKSSRSDHRELEMDARASKLVAELPSKEHTESYQELTSGEIEMVLTRVTMDGTTSTIRLTWPAAGGAVQDPAGVLGKGKSAVETLLGPGDWLVTFMDHGKQWSTMRKVISPDGRTMTQTANFLDSHGRTLTQILIFHR